ncbi:hypothetical protein CI1B_36440 [Bradyrhizobium ivorense]|uniref:Uncharacterized protein n=1 Tax=Bradyrhizobium ivorense TaxID=2511166 RepID=A0A508TB38_9BRAD|nr:hypothetical protein CI1B_36440 [Bradyrhizobium ivorense]
MNTFQWCVVPVSIICVGALILTTLIVVGAW